jgi:two-component system sensor histidine kinase UhpB
MHEESAAYLDLVREQERIRIAREIHDELGGNLIAIKMAFAQLSRNLPADNADLHDKAAYVDTLVDRTIEAAHLLTSNLRPQILNRGLVAALAWQTREFEKQSGITCIFKAVEADIDLPLERATALFRIAQEALTNIGKHADARQVKVQLLRNGDQMRLEIADDGKGISPADRAKSQSFGIRGMIERVELFGGSLSIESGAQGGTILIISLPMNNKIV